MPRAMLTATCRAPAPADKALLARYLLHEGFNLRFRLGDDAMRPWLPNGSTVCVAPIPFEGLRRHDVVAIEPTPGTFVARRVVQIEHRWIHTRADGERTVEPPRPRTEIVSRVIRIEAPFKMRLDTTTSRLLSGLSSTIFSLFARETANGLAEHDRAEAPYNERGPLCEERTILN